MTIAREMHPDAITLDVMMPQMDGWSVLTALKADPDLCDIPVIMVTILNDRAIALSLGSVGLPHQADRLGRLNAMLRQYIGTSVSGAVLVVDDDPEMRAMTRQMLERMGLEVGGGGERRRRPRLARSQPAAGAHPARSHDAGHGRLRVPRSYCARASPGVRCRCWWSLRRISTPTSSISSQGLTEKVIAKGATTGVDLRAAIRDALRSAAAHSRPAVS